MCVWGSGDPHYSRSGDRRYKFREFPYPDVAEEGPENRDKRTEGRAFLSRFAGWLMIHLVPCVQPMTHSGISLRLLFSAFVLLALPGTSVTAQAVAVADHHAHLQSPTAARLLNEGAILQPGAPPNEEEEKPNTAADLIAQLDAAGTRAAGIRRSVALSDAYRLGSPFVHVSGEAAAVDAENDWTLHQVQLYPQRLVGFCSVNPTRPYAIAAIEHCARIGLRGGLKLHLANAQYRFDDPAQIRELQDVFAAANRLRMPILTGSWTHVLFGAPRTEYICPYGHGTLKVAELQITGHQYPDWEPHEDIWKELYSLEESNK